MKTRENSVWRIGEILIQKGWLDWSQLEVALALQKTSENHRIGEILVENRIITSQHLFRALALQFNMPFVDLQHVSVQPEAVVSVPKRLAYEYHLMPLVKRAETLLIAVSDPMNIWPEIEIQAASRMRDIRTALAAPGDIDWALRRYYGPEGLAVA